MKNKNYITKILCLNIFLIVMLMVCLPFSLALTPSECVAVGTGGTVTVDGGYCIHTFTTNGTFELSTEIDTGSFLIVAGGGAGGSQSDPEADYGSGGGAGGVVISNFSNYTLTTGAHDIIVGVGGVGVSNQPSTNGTLSSIDSIIAFGGGGGAYPYHAGPGQDGGSAGGGSGFGVGGISLQVNYTNAVGYGNVGGDGQSDTNAPAGGGGASTAGGDNIGTTGGAGGDGIGCDIYNGTTLYYGGGGGGSYTFPGIGGLGGGGNGTGYGLGNQQPGINGTGGGGGGATSPATGVGGLGGSGIVSIRYFFELPWWNVSYDYRKEIIITEQNDSTLSNYSVAINITNLTNIQSDCSDVRFVSSGNEELYYYREGYSGTSCFFYVKIPSLTAGENTSIYMYYGNLTPVSTTSDLDNAFIFGDDFITDTLSNYWHNASTPAESAAWVWNSTDNTITGSRAAAPAWVTSWLSPKAEFQRINDSYILETKYKRLSTRNWNSGIVSYSNPEPIYTIGWNNYLGNIGTALLLTDPDLRVTTGFVSYANNYYVQKTVLTGNGTTRASISNVTDEGIIELATAIYDSSKYSGGTYIPIYFINGLNAESVTLDWTRVRPIVNFEPTYTLEAESLQPQVLSISNLLPPNNTWTANNTINFTGDISGDDNLTSATIYLNYTNGTFVNQTTTAFDPGITTTVVGFPIFILQGLYTWFIEVFDTETSVTSQVNILNVDNGHPLIEFSYPTLANGANASQTFIFANVSASDANEINITFKLMDESNSTINETTLGAGNRSFNWTNVSDGVYYYNVTICDIIDLCNSTETRRIILDTNSPTINLTYPIQDDFINESIVNFTWVINDTGSGIKNSTIYVYNQSLLKHKPITITGTIPSNYSIFLIIDKAPSMSSDYHDVYFKDLSGNELPYYIENYTATNASIWVRIQNNNTFNMYYNNTYFVNQSNFNNAFIYADDFLTDTSSNYLENDVSWGNFNIDTNNEGRMVQECVIPYTTGKYIVYPNQSLLPINSSYIFEVSMKHTNVGNYKIGMVSLMSPITDYYLFNNNVNPGGRLLELEHYAAYIGLGNIAFTSSTDVYYLYRMEMMGNNSMRATVSDITSGEVLKTINADDATTNEGYIGTLVYGVGGTNLTSDIDWIRFRPYADNPSYIIGGETGGIINQTTTTSFTDIFNTIVGIPITLVDGFFSWFVESFDFAGNVATSDAQNFTIDTIAPQINFTSPTYPNNSYINLTNIFVNVSLVEENEGNITFILNGNSTTFNETYATVIEECYQESTNTTNQSGTDGSCVLNYTGTYSSKAAQTPNPNGYYSGELNITYIKPVNSSGANWTMVHGRYSGDGGNWNETVVIPAVCWNADATNVLIQMKSQSIWEPHGDGKARNWGSCWNGTDFQNITTIGGGTYVQGGVGVGGDNESHLYDGNWTTVVYPVNGYKTTCDDVDWCAEIALYEEGISWYIDTDDYSDILPTSYNWTNLADGVYDYQVTTTDLSGNTNSTEVKTITIDTVSPNVTSILPINNTYTNESTTNFTFAVNDTGSGISNATIYVYGDAWAVSGLDDGLLSSYNFDEGSGTKVDDLTNQSRDLGAYLTSTLTWNDISVSGKSLDLNITNQAYNTSYTFTEATPFTFSYWVYRKDDTGNKQFIGTTPTGSVFDAFKGITMYDQDFGGPGRFASVYICGSGGATNWGSLGCIHKISATTALGINQWYHIVGTWNGTATAESVKIYVDGAEESYQGTLDGLTGTFSNTGIVLGGQDTYKKNYLIDDLSIWNRTLDLSEVTLLYNNGNGAFYDESSLVNETTVTTFSDIFNTIVGVPITLIDGVYTWFTKAFDFAGNSATSETRDLTIDTAFPQIEFTLPTETNNSFVNQDFIFANVSVTEDYEANITFTLNGSSTIFTNQTRSYNWTSLSDGVYDYQVSVTDLSDNTNSTELRTITLDTVAPNMNLTSPDDNYLTNETSQNFTADISDNYELSNVTFNIYYPNDTIYDSTFYDIFLENTTTYSALTNVNLVHGLFNWNYQVTDKAGITTSSENRSVYIDTEPPTISLTSPTNKSHINGVANFTANILNDFSNLSGATLYIYNSTGVLVNETFTNLSALETNETILGILINLSLYSELDTFTWYYNATDTYGHEGKAPTYEVTIDTVLPEILWYTPTIGEKPWTNITSFTMNVQVSDAFLDATNLSIYNATGELYYNNFTSNLTVTTIALTDTFTLQEGLNIINVCARDSLAGSPVIQNDSRFVKTNSEETLFYLPNNHSILREIIIKDADNNKLNATYYNLTTLEDWVDDGRHYKTEWQLQNLPNGTFFEIVMNYEGDDLELLTDRNVTRIIDKDRTYYWRFDDLNDNGFDVEYTWQPEDNKIEIKVTKGTYEPIDGLWSLDPLVGGLNVNCNNESVYLDTQVPNAILNTPLDNNYTNITSQNLTVNLTDNLGIKNATLFVWNETGLYNETSYTNYVLDTLESTLGIVVVLVDNTYDWWYQVWDWAGNTFSSGNNTLTIDTIAPLINITYPEDLDYYNVSTLEYTFIDANPLNCWYSTDGGLTNNSLTCGNNVSGLMSNQGNNTWMVRIEDYLNSINQDYVTFFIDNIYPDIEYVDPTDSNGTYVDKSNIEINVTASDTNLRNITIYLYNGAGSLVQSSTNATTNETTLNIFENYTSLADGIYDFNATARDRLNNANSTLTRTIVLDTTNPIIDYSTPTLAAGGPYNQTAIWANLSASDTNLYSISAILELISGNIITYKNVTTKVPTANGSDSLYLNWTSLSQGIYRLSGNATDKVNRTTWITNRTFNVDTEPPITNYVYPTPDDGITLPKNSFIVNVTAIDPNLANIVIYYWYQNETVYSTSTTENVSTLNQTTLADGVHYYNVSASDTEGRTTWLPTRNITTEYYVVNVTVCRELFLDGATYLVQKDLTANDSSTTCLNVTANNINLDCSGYLITGPSGAGNSSVLVNAGVTGLEIRNCYATTSGGRALIVGTSPASVTVYNSTFTGSDYGIYVAPEANLYADTITVTNNNYGIYFNDSANSNTLVNVFMSGNVNDSITFINSSYNAINNLTMTTATDPENNGVIVFNTSTDNNFSGCAISSVNARVWGLYDYSINNLLDSCYYISSGQDYVDGTSQLIRSWPFTGLVLDKALTEMQGATITFIASEPTNQNVTYKNSSKTLSYETLSGVTYTNSPGLAHAPVIEYMNIFGTHYNSTPYYFNASYNIFTPTIALLTVNDSTYHEFILGDEIASSSLSRTAMWLILGIVFLIGIAASIGFFMVRMREGYSVVDIWKYFIILVIWLVLFTVIYFALAWFIMGSFYPRI